MEIIPQKKIWEKCAGSVSEVMSTSFGTLEMFNKPTESFSIFLGNLDVFNKPIESMTIIN